MGVSKNRGTPKSSILIGFSIIFTMHFGGFPPFLVQHPYQASQTLCVDFGDFPPPASQKHPTEVQTFV